jgi:hypothetical protein
MRHEAVVSCFCSIVLVFFLEENHENFQRGTRFADEGLTLGSTEFESRLLTVESRHVYINKDPELVFFFCRASSVCPYNKIFCGLAGHKYAYFMAVLL